MSGWNILFHLFALSAAFLGLLFPEFHSPLIDRAHNACTAQAQIGPTLGLLFAPMMVRLTRHSRHMSPLEYVLIALCLTPFVLGLTIGDCVSFATSLAARNVPLTLTVLAVLGTVVTAARLGTDDACRLPPRKKV